MRVGRLLRFISAVTAVPLGTLLLVALVIRAGGFPAGEALRALVSGSVGSLDAFFSATLVRTIPLLLTGLGVAIAFQAGVFNIGAEGQLLAGASAATAAVLAIPSPGTWSLVFALLAAVGAGAAWAAIPAILRVRYGALEVITTIMMNFLGIQLVSYLVRGPMQEPTHIYPQSASLPQASMLPVILTGSRLHAGIVLSLGLALGLWVVFRYTAVGFRLRASGASPTAAASTGRINIRRITLGAFLASGALAGLAGGVEVTGVTYALYENLSPGYGYSAIGVALLARLHPLWIIPSAILFGGLEAGAGAMQRDAGIPAGFVGIVEGLIILALLAVRELGPRMAGASHVLTPEE